MLSSHWYCQALVHTFRFSPSCTILVVRKYYLNFLAPTGAQGVTICVVSVCPSSFDLITLLLLLFSKLDIIAVQLVTLTWAEPALAPGDQSPSHLGMPRHNIGIIDWEQKLFKNQPADRYNRLNPLQIFSTTLDTESVSIYINLCCVLFEFLM